MGLRNIKRHVVSCVLAGAFLSAVPAFAAIDAYMVIKGERQGQIKGEGMSEKIAVTSVSHDATMAAGMTSGKRQHGSITIRKEVDSASPKLMQSMNTHEPLSDVMIVFKTSGAGAGKVAQTINLKDAMISSVRVSGRTETITIEYDTIQVAYTNGNKTATDDWSVPN
jgi:type VI secretion system Hcp family effector